MPDIRFDRFTGRNYGSINNYPDVSHGIGRYLHENDDFRSSEISRVEFKARKLDVI